MTHEILNSLSTEPYHNDEMWLDTRSQYDRNLQKTGEMYELQQKNIKEEKERTQNKKIGW